MTVKVGNTKYKPADYSNWNGMKIGMIAGNSKNDVFKKFAKEKGFSFVQKDFTQVDEMILQLQNGQIDAVVSGSLRKLDHEWIYEQLDLRPFYIIVKKGNTKLLEQVNSALQQLEIVCPDFAGILQRKYYNNMMSGSSEIPLTIAETNYQKQCFDSEKKFTVLVNPDRYPFSYFEGSDFSGVMRELMNLIEQRSGLEFSVIKCKTRNEYFDALAEGKADFILDMRHDYSIAESCGYLLTPSYISATVSRITLKRFSGIPKTVALVKDSNMLDIIKKNLPTGTKIITCPTMKDVTKSVLNAEVDAGFIFTRAAENEILNDTSSTLSFDPAGFVIPFSVGINRKLDKNALFIMTKAVRSLSAEEVQKAVLSSNLKIHRRPTIREFISENPFAVSIPLGFLSLTLAVCLVAVIVFRKKADRSDAILKKNSRMWKLLSDSLPIHIFAKDATQNFRYVFSNKARSDFYGKDFSNFNDESFFTEEFYKARQKDDLDALANPNEITTRTLDIKNSLGEVRRLRSQQKPFFDKDGTKLLLSCSIDITDLEDARELAEKNAERFRKTLISIGDAVMTTDTNGRITLLNHVAEKLLGYTLAEAKGMPHSDVFRIVSYPDGAYVQSPVDEVLKTGNIITLKNHTDLISKSGSRFHIADSAAPIKGRNGVIDGVILVFRDVTEEYNLRDKLKESYNNLHDALEQAKLASKAKGVFLSQMSHEIRTPLNAIIGYLNIAIDSADDSKKVGNCLTKGLGASQHLLSIINDILDISSIESGKMRIANEDFDFKHLLTGIVSIFYNQAQAKKIRFEMNLCDFSEEWLVGDSMRLNQILLNLLSNAMKFTDEGGSITLQVKQLGIINNKVQLMFRVSDTGCGMSHDFKKRLFSPFEQQDASTARKYGGTGLGLSITRNLVLMMDGSIKVESEENKGTTFEVNLPFGKSTKEMFSSDKNKFSKLRALIVDDVADDREYISMVLRNCGVKSDAVESGEEAIAQMTRRLSSNHPYDLCLLDLRLKGIDGIETARRLRTLNEKSNIPIILVTAYDISEVYADAHSAGVNKVIEKPIFQSTFFDFLMTTYGYQNESKPKSSIKEKLKEMKIMLVEDNQMNMDISNQILSKAGLIVTQAWNGKEAVDIFEKSSPDTFAAILMDVQMPVMDGYQATEKIRSSTHPNAKTIPIIAMTANAFNEDVVKAIQSGMNDHISKPIVYEQLFASLAKLTNKKDYD